MRKWISPAAAMILTVLAASAGAQSRQTPYWASISQDRARMRVGPNTDYPTSWVYKRRDLPVKVIDIYASWRKVQDPGGTEGWMHVSQLSAQPTAIVTAGEAQLREQPDTGAPIRFRARAGVVGRISDCAKNWCAMDVGGRRGFIAVDQLWGATR